MSLPVAPPDVASARRLGERACVVDAGGQFTAARQVDDLAAHAAVGGAREFVFDLGGVRRYETEALVELSALCRRLTSYGCEVIVAAHDPGVVLELRRLSHGDGWQIAPTLTLGARRDLLLAADLARRLRTCSASSGSPASGCPCPRCTGSSSRSGSAPPRRAGSARPRRRGSGP